MIFKVCENKRNLIFPAPQSSELTVGYPAADPVWAAEVSGSSQLRSKGKNLVEQRQALIHAAHVAAPQRANRSSQHCLGRVARLRRIHAERQDCHAVQMALSPASAHGTSPPTANQCDCTATLISPVAGSTQR